MKIFGYKTLPRPIEPSERKFDIDYFKELFHYIVKDQKKLLQSEVPFMADSQGRIFWLAINARYPSTREENQALEAFRQDLMQNHHWAHVSFGSSPRDSYVSVTLRFEGYTPTDKDPEYKVKYCFVAWPWRIAEIKRTDLPEDAPKDQVYHWLLIDDEVVHPLQYVSMMSGPKNFESREFKTSFRHFKRAFLEFDGSSARIINHFEGGTATTKMTQVRTDGGLAELHEVLDPIIKNYLREQDAKR